MLKKSKRCLQHLMPHFLHNQKDYLLKVLPHKWKTRLFKKDAAWITLPKKDLAKEMTIFAFRNTAKSVRERRDPLPCDLAARILHCSAGDGSFCFSALGLLCFCNAAFLTGLLRTLAAGLGLETKNKKKTNQKKTNKHKKKKNKSNNADQRIRSQSAPEETRNRTMKNCAIKTFSLKTENFNCHQYYLN